MWDYIRQCHVCSMCSSACAVERCWEVVSLKWIAAAVWHASTCRSFQRSSLFNQTTCLGPSSCHCLWHQLTFQRSWLFNQTTYPTHSSCITLCHCSWHPSIFQRFGLFNQTTYPTHSSCITFIQRSGLLMLRSTWVLRRRGKLGSSRPETERADTFLFSKCTAVPHPICADGSDVEIAGPSRPKSAGTFS